MDTAGWKVGNCMRICKRENENPSSKELYRENMIDGHNVRRRTMWSKVSRVHLTRLTQGLSGAEKTRSKMERSADPTLLLHPRDPVIHSRLETSEWEYFAAGTSLGA